MASGLLQASINLGNLYGISNKDTSFKAPSTRFSIVPEQKNRTRYPKTRHSYRLIKGFHSKFPEGFIDQQTPEEGWMEQQSKYDNNKVEDIIPNLKILTEILPLIHRK